MWPSQWLPFSQGSAAAPPSSAGAGSPSQRGGTAPPPVPQGSNGLTLNAGDAVEYFSASQGNWIPARVLAVNANGTYTLDVKPNVTADKVRAAPAPGKALPSSAPPASPAVYAPGESVQYFSASGGAWIHASVRAVNADGTYDLDCKPRVPANKIRKQEAASAATSSPSRAPPGSHSNGYSSRAPPGSASGAYPGRAPACH